MGEVEVSPVAERSYGWIPDSHDERDVEFAPTVVHLPASVDLAADRAMPPVWDQGRLGSCTAHGTLACFLWASAKCGARDPMLSRLMLYYDTRAASGTVDQDSGAQIRDAVKATRAGICPETLWPYDVARFAEEPSPRARQAAAANVGVSYRRVRASTFAIKACLAEGFPVDFGFTVFESFESADVAASGLVPMPQSWEREVGGHCVATVGYDDARQAFKIRNSLGPGWGLAGYCWMSYEYVRRFASDFWTIRTVT
jgi:C1A family cysteine protease